MIVPKIPIPRLIQSIRRMPAAGCQCGRGPGSIAAKPNGRMVAESDLKTGEPVSTIAGYRFGIGHVFRCAAVDASTSSALTS
jgi:hypothetical protein